MHNQAVDLLRAVTGLQIPSGMPIDLAEGDRVYVTQRMGSTITVATNTGLVRLAGADSDALGLTQEESAPTNSLPDTATLEERVWHELSSIFDPEIPVDIVNLGLIYDVVITHIELNLHHVAIKMTLTAPGCGMGPILMQEAQARVAALSGVETADVDMVWDPPWNQDMVSEEGKMKLGLL